jgi:hypothetical protein
MKIEKKCKDCVFAKVSWFSWLTEGWRYARCSNPELGYNEPDYVTGEIHTHFNTCRHEREAGKCGIKGDYWKSKKEEPVIKIRRSF